MGAKEYKNLKEIYYFKNATNETIKNDNNNDAENIHEKVSLTFSLENCESNNTYSFNFYSFENNQMKHLLSSNKVQSNSTFDNSIIMNYFFEKEQKLKIDITKNDRNLTINTTLGAILGSKKNTYRKQLEEEFFIITANKIDEKNMNYLSVIFEIKSNINFNQSKISFFYLISSSTKLYSSSSIKQNEKLPEIEIPLNLLPQFKIEFYDYKKNKLHTINDLQSFISTKQINLTIKNKSITINNFSSIKKKYTFIDYLKAGVQLGLQIGIDFTGSNGDPRDTGTLHSIVDNKQNDYECVILSCGNIVAYYDYDQLFPVFGFGAIINDSGINEANMCFAINFNEQNPFIYTIPNILQVYKECLMKITFSGPTYFSPIIKKVNDFIRNNKNNLEYQILMILTDGIINDMDETVDTLVEGSFLPLSVIIIGIGDADFTNMNVLDGDDVPLVSSKGVKRMRDLVQFVEFNKFRNDPQKLAEEVLEEIPRQVVEYYSKNNLFPDNLIS